MFKRIREIIILLVIGYVALYFLNSEITDAINAQIFALFKPKTEQTTTENQVNQLSEEQLDNTKIYQSIAEASGSLEQVVKLNLSGQKLSEIPAEVFQMKNLQYLDLSNNALIQLPDEIQNLGQLQEIQLANNQISTISSKIDELAFLQKLDLSNNQLTTLPDIMSNLGKLEELNLAGNKQLNIKKALNDLGYSRNLKKLILKNNSLEIQKELKELKRLLPNLVVE